MAYVWIQPWYYALPVILEEPVMGDGNRGQAPLDQQAQNYSNRELFATPSHCLRADFSSFVRLKASSRTESIGAVQHGD